MSAIAAIFRRDGEPIPEATVAAIADRLGHRGPDGRDRWSEGGAAITHLHHWSTPEEASERQPLRMGDWTLALDGRLDNRDELARALGLAVDVVAATSDARLVLMALAAWGEGTWRRLIGPFAVALWDRSAGRAFLVRDGLGDRTIFYADLDGELVVASEEHALLAHPSLSGDLDERRLVAYFAGEVPGDGSTFFGGVSELEPGVVVEFGPAGFRTGRYWSVPERSGGEDLDDDEAADRFRETLTLAVTSRLRSPGPVAVLMSGGIDSTSLAALAREHDADSRVRAVSWVFDDLADCDERAYIAPVVERLGLELRHVLGDDLGPDPDDPSMCSSPSGPEESPYRRLKARAYETAASWGCGVVLSGGSADALYTGYERWVADLFRSRRWGRALSELLADLGRSGVRTGLRRAGVARSGGLRSPRWLTPEARAAWREMAPPGSPGRVHSIAGPRPARSISAEIFHAAGAGIDLRHPYRDRRLVELMLGMPAYRLYRNGRFKPIARRALRGRLPEVVLERARPTLLTPLFDSALRGRRRREWRSLLDASDARWPRYVRRDWIDAALERSAGPTGDVALWNCIAFELWRRRFSR